MTATATHTLLSAIQASLARRQTRDDDVSRAALGSGAVLASLGSRPAWTQTALGCMSVATIASFNPQTGMFVSAPGGRPEHDEALAAEIHYVVGPNSRDYLGTGPGSDGEIYTACRDRDARDYVCLIEGKWNGAKCPKDN